MTTIYPALNAKIQTILESLTKISEIHAYPATKLDSYPAAIYFPSSIENAFETTADNFKTYGYKLFIVVNAGDKPVNEVFSEIMPPVMDEVIETFDDEWNFTEINGHRVWCKIDTGAWSVSEEQAGIEITAEINLSIKMLTS